LSVSGLALFDPAIVLPVTIHDRIPAGRTCQVCKVIVSSAAESYDGWIGLLIGSTVIRRKRWAVML
jgi:hypothetical protein